VDINLNGVYHAMHAAILAMLDAGGGVIVNISSGAATKALEGWSSNGVGKVGGFSLHAGVAARADQRQKLERLCRHISRPAISEKRLSLTPNGNLRYQLKTP